MSAAAPSTSSPKIASAERHSFTPVMLLIAATLGLLWFVFLQHLSSEWSLNDQYSYGWFVPFFAAYLFWLRWQDRPEPAIRSQKSEVRKGGANAPSAPPIGHPISDIRYLTALAIAALLLLLPLRLIEIANPDWRPLAWIHAACVITLTLLLIYQLGGRPWVVHFAFPILFVLTAVPWISAIEEPIVQGLMRIIASIATETVSLLGIPAEVQGNLIRISRGLVGVNEACSGVRSLQTSIMVGLLFGELKRLTTPRRLALLAGAIAIALVANLFRAVFLVWMAASNGLAEVEHWHDTAGYIIVGVVFAGSLLLAFLLSRSQPEETLKAANGNRKSEIGWRKEVRSDIGRGEEQKHQTSNLKPQTSVASLPFLIATLVFLLLCEVGARAWYLFHENDLSQSVAWTVQAPSGNRAVQQVKIDEGVRQTLRYDNGAQFVWKNVASPNEQTTTYLFFFRWNAGSSSVLRARAHRPDICLPSVGWKQTENLGIKNYRTSNNLEIPARHVVFAQPVGSRVAHTFFSLQEDKNESDHSETNSDFKEGVQPDWGPVSRLRAVENGVRNLGQQILEIVITGDARLSDAEAERLFTDTLNQVVVPNH